MRNYSAVTPRNVSAESFDGDKNKWHLEGFTLKLLQ